MDIKWSSQMTGLLNFLSLLWLSHTAREQNHDQCTILKSSNGVNVHCLPNFRKPRGLHKAVVHTPNTVYPSLKAPPGLVTGRGKSPFYIGTGIKWKKVQCALEMCALVLDRNGNKNLLFPIVPVPVLIPFMFTCSVAIPLHVTMIWNIKK